MIDQLNYQREVSVLQSEKNNFTVTNYFPQYASSNRKTVKADIENQLFTVFRKYEQNHIVQEQKAQIHREGNDKSEDGKKENHNSLNLKNGIKDV